MPWAGRPFTGRGGAADAAVRATSYLHEHPTSPTMPGGALCGNAVATFVGAGSFVPLPACVLHVSQHLPHGTAQSPGFPALRECLRASAFRSGGSSPKRCRAGFDCVGRRTVKGVVARFQSRALLAMASMQSSATATGVPAAGVVDARRGRHLPAVQHARFRLPGQAPGAHQAAFSGHSWRYQEQRRRSHRRTRMHTESVVPD